MLYKCISLESAVVPATAKRNANAVYFQAQFVPKDDLVNTKLIKVNLFPTTDQQLAMYQELVDNNKVLVDQQYIKVSVDLPDFKMVDSETGAFRDKIYDSMDVYVRLINNDEWFEGSNLPKLAKEHDPKKLAIRTVERLGKFIGKSTHEVDTVDEVPATPVTTPVPPVTPVATPPAQPQ